MSGELAKYWRLNCSNKHQQNFPTIFHWTWMVYMVYRHLTDNSQAFICVVWPSVWPSSKTASRWWLKVRHQYQCQYSLIILTRVEHYWANIERCECPTLTALKFNQPHNSRHLITWGPQQASKDFLQTYISCRLYEDVCMCERESYMHACEQIPNIPCLPFKRVKG